jgi:hypothetical protein
MYYENVTSSVTFPDNKDPNHIAIYIKNQGFEHAKNLTLSTGQSSLDII